MEQTGGIFRKPWHMPRPRRFSPPAGVVSYTGSVMLLWWV